MNRAVNVTFVAIGIFTTGCSNESGSGVSIETVGEADSAVFITTTSLTPGTPATGDSVAATDPPNSTNSVSTEAAPATVPVTVPVTEATTPVEAVVGNPVVQLAEVGTFDGPVDLAVRPGDSAFYIVEQSGHVARLIDGTSTIVADVSDRITPGGEQGLLGLAFSPDAALAYLDFIDANGDTVVAEYPVAADGIIDIAAERVLLIVDQPYVNHNGGDLEFGPDGMLYIALGDGGSANDPERRASDTFDLLGKLLRIDPTRNGDAAYTIPPDNPFADGVSGAPEVWSFGLRNPWKLGFDPTNGDLWIADVGQDRYEEINVVSSIDGVTAGRAANFGWSAFEATDRFNDDVADPGNTVFPVLTYEHGADGCSVSGGVVYHGTAIPELEPAYVYGDYCSGRLWALDRAGERNLLLLTGLPGITAVRTGPDGEIYVLQRGGNVSRLTAT